jgi:hypothetical protein
VSQFSNIAHFINVKLGKLIVVNYALLDYTRLCRIRIPFWLLGSQPREATAWLSMHDRRRNRLVFVVRAICLKMDRQGRRGAGYSVIFINYITAT